MPRKTFDLLASIGGFGLTLVLVVAGALLMWGYSYTNGTVYSQLSAQNITFPSKAAFAHPKAGTEITPSMIPSVSQYAGQKLTNGAQAEVYANDFIAVHLNEIGHGKTYSQLSALSRANPGNTALAAEVQTVFQGTTLRSMLLNAYAFWMIGQIALVSAIVSFALAAVMLVLSVLGLMHERSAPDAARVFVGRHRTA